MFNATVSPEQRLWIAVLELYIYDLVTLMRKKRLQKEKCKKYNSPIWQKKLDKIEKDLQYLIYFIDHEWIETLCDLAGITPRYFREHVNEFIKSASDIDKGGAFSYGNHLDFMRRRPKEFEG